MDARANFLGLILLDALEDENEGDINNILSTNNIDASYVLPERGIAPLHYAAGMDNEAMSLNMIKVFLEHGANPNVCSDEHMTPLHIAALYGRVEIVKLLLQYGAELNVIDDEHKSPVHYAIEECHFEIVQLMRDHIFKEKKKLKQNQLKQQRFQATPNKIPQSNENELYKSTIYTPKEKNDLNMKVIPSGLNTPLLAVNDKNKSPLVLKSTPSHLNHNNNTPGLNAHLTAPNRDESPAVAKSTPNRLYYNNNTTSPYYINITHRRHKPQPKFPELMFTSKESNVTADEGNGTSNEESAQETQIPAILEDQTSPRKVNIFSLTKENLHEYSNVASDAERSRMSLVEQWRQKVQRSKARKSILMEFENVEDMVDNVMKDSRLNFTNVLLKETSPNESDNTKEKDENVTYGDTLNRAFLLEQSIKPSNVEIVCEKSSPPLPKMNTQPNMSLGQVIQRIAQAHVEDFEIESEFQTARSAGGNSSYGTVPEMEINESTEIDNNLLQVPNADLEVKLSPEKDNKLLKVPNADFIRRSPTTLPYILQMTEAYVHTDNETGLVFYEKKLLSNHNKKDDQVTTQDSNTSRSTQSTNLTLPLDYETDALRAELTTFGEPPGPITKTTKRLYIKRLVKYKRNSKKLNTKETEKDFSVELCRTTRSADAFKNISEFVKYEAESAEYFANHNDKKKMREGHLKQSFIYLLIDPRVSCNLPGEMPFLNSFDIWKRFLHSIFYVGKGKTSRPYSHLYQAMKTHSRLHNDSLQVKQNTQAENGKKKISKSKFSNLELLKSPPTKSSNNKKLDRILEIWGNGNGVVCLHVFHNIMPTEAYTREAAMIEAIGLHHLTNVKRGDYYGPAKMWTMKEKKYLGIALLYKAMQIYLAEGESQLSPSDLI